MFIWSPPYRWLLRLLLCVCCMSFPAVSKPILCFISKTFLTLLYLNERNLTFFHFICTQYSISKAVVSIKKSNISFKFGKQHLVSFMFYMHLRLIRRGPLSIVPTQNIQSVVLKSSSMDVHLCKLLDLDSISNSSTSVINLFHKT